MLRLALSLSSRCTPCVSAVACIAGERCFTSSKAIWSSEEFVGAYTPMTKKLWQERLRLTQMPLEQQQQGSEPVTPDAARPPQQTVVQYAFSTDKYLLEMYRNPWGYLRMGRLLEDLDSLAGSIAFMHCHTPGLPPPHLVTVSVDAIEYSHNVTLSTDVTVQGQVVYTGGSSLDIRMELLQEPHAPDPSLVALFSFVLLDATTKRPSRVPPLLPETFQEEAWAAERAAVAAERKLERQNTKAAGKVTLSPDKQQHLDALLQASQLQRDMPALADPLALPASATSLSNAFVCQPQQRNMHGRIFGGFLMRRAFELAFATTYMFAGSRPAFVRVDDITFRNPVSVGSLLRFQSHVIDVTYPEPDSALVAVEVAAVVSEPEHKATTHTNTFRYVFRVALSPGQKLRRVLPSSAADVERLTRFLADSD